LTGTWTIAGLASLGAACALAGSALASSPAISRTFDVRVAINASATGNDGAQTADERATIGVTFRGVRLQFGTPQSGTTGLVLKESSIHASATAKGTESDVFHARSDPGARDPSPPCEWSSTNGVSFALDVYTQSSIAPNSRGRQRLVVNLRASASGAIEPACVDFPFSQTLVELDARSANWSAQGSFGISPQLAVRFAFEKPQLAGRPPYQFPFDRLATGKSFTITAPIRQREEPQVKTAGTMTVQFIAR
jgi:hypothetical protein